MIKADDKELIDSLYFDILDTTIEWPHYMIPHVEVGELVYTQNVDS